MSTKYLAGEGLKVGDRIVLNNNEQFWPGRKGRIEHISTADVDFPMLSLVMEPWGKGYIEEQRIFRTPKFVSLDLDYAEDLNMVGEERKPGGSNPKQYGLPENVKDLQDLIEYRDMNFAVGNIFKACYRLGTCSHSDELRDLRKILWFADRELKRLEKNNVEG